MEIPDIHIPHIDIPVVYIPNTPAIIPGCQYTHRDIDLNPNLLLDDPSGVYTNCPEGEIPSHYSMPWNDGIKIIEEEYIPSSNEPEIPETKKTDLRTPTKPPPDFVPCPGPKDQKMGDFRNNKRLEIVIGWELSDDGKDCITLYEPVTFVDSVLPSTSAALNVGIISLIAASSPLLLNVIKGASKSLFKKILTRKKKENDDEVKPD